MAADTSCFGERPKVSDREHVDSFSDDPVEYLKQCWAEGTEYMRKRRDEVKDNRAFYRGVDPVLEKRRADKDFCRSALFVNEIRPAIDTGIAAILDNVIEDIEGFLVFVPDDNEDQEATNELSSVLNKRLQKQGWLSNTLRTLLLASRTDKVVFVEIGWDEKYDWVSELVPAPTGVKGLVEALKYAAGLRKRPPVDHVKTTWKIADEGPYGKFLDWGELIYDPTAHDFQQGRYCIRIDHPSTEELRNHAEVAGWNMEVVDQMIEDKDESGDQKGQSVADADRKLFTGLTDDYDEHAHEIHEFWIPTWDSDGKLDVRRIVMGGADNKYLLSKNDKGDPTPCRHIRFPFLPFATTRKVNQIEGDPHVERVRDIQREHNDLHNAINDILSYGIFSGIIQGEDGEFLEEPVRAPGFNWHVKDVTQILPMGPEIDGLNELSMLATSTKQKIREDLNTPDFSTGAQMDIKEEKVFQTKLRAQGSARRSRSDYKEVADMLIQMVQQWVYMYQEHGQIEYMKAFSIDIPALTGNYSPQEEIERAMMTYTIAKDSPLYQSPVGAMKLRNLIEIIYRKMRWRNIENILPTKEELQQAMMPAIDPNQAGAPSPIPGQTDNQTIPGGNPQEQITGPEEQGASDGNLQS